MWKPAEVIHVHRKRAVFLFFIQIATIIAYTSWLVHSAVEKTRNPSTSFVLSSDPYMYPDVYVCPYAFRGCDTEEDEAACAASAFTTEGGLSSATYNPGRDREQALEANVTSTYRPGWRDTNESCVTFYASAIEVSGAVRDPEDWILIDMFWNPGGSNSSTTCVDVDGAWESHSESVMIFLRDPETGIYSAGIQVPYTCMTSASNSHGFTFVGVGLTIENKLGEENRASYKALETSTALHKDKYDEQIAAIVRPFAYMSMELAQLTDSLEVITEIDPLEVAEIFGNIGGFWDLLLIFWPIFFIAASSRDPELKARNFRKSVAKATSAVALVNHSLEFKRRSFSGDERVIKPAIAQVETEKRPSWDSAKTDTDRYVTAEANFQKACPDRGQFRPPLLSSSSSLSYSSTECERSVSPLPRPGLRQQESQESPSPPPRHIEQQQTSGILPL